MTPFNLLITDPHTPQSYDIVLSLRDRCRKIFVSIPDVVRFKGLVFFTSNSNYVDRVYRLNSRFFAAERDIWDSFGVTDPEEEEYIDELVGICSENKINLIYPTSDNEVILLAKHIKKFAKYGISLPVNPYNMLIYINDKHWAVRKLEHAGIPVPPTLLLQDIAADRSRCDNLKYPMIIKPRFGSTAKNVRIVSSPDDLQRLLTFYGSRSGEYILQDYIPGDTMLYLRFYVNKDGFIIYRSCVSATRPEMLMFQSSGLVLEKSEFPEFTEKMGDILCELNYTGYAHFQLKKDTRDGKYKFLEINTRISRGTWTEMIMGIDSAKISLDLTEGKNLQDIRKTKNDEDTIFIWPVQDVIILLLWIVNRVTGSVCMFLRSRNTELLTPGFREIFRHYSKIYLFSKKKKIADNYFRYFTRDYAVGLAYWAHFFLKSVGDCSKFVRPRPKKSEMH